MTKPGPKKDKGKWTEEIGKIVVGFIVGAVILGGLLYAITASFKNEQKHEQVLKKLDESNGRVKGICEIILIVATKLNIDPKELKKLVADSKTITGVDERFGYVSTIAKMRSTFPEEQDELTEKRFHVLANGKIEADDATARIEKLIAKLKDLEISQQVVLAEVKRERSLSDKFDDAEARIDSLIKKVSDMEFDLKALYTASLRMELIQREISSRMRLIEDRPKGYE